MSQAPYLARIPTAYLKIKKIYILAAYLVLKILLKLTINVVQKMPLISVAIASYKISSSGWFRKFTMTDNIVISTLFVILYSIKKWRRNENY